MVEKIRRSSKSESAIIALDFDDTLFSMENFPNPGEPNWDVIETAKKCQQEYGAKLVLWTCRSSGTEIAKAVIAARNVGLNFDAINDNAVWDPGSRKIYATIYVDDRSPGSIEYFVNHFIDDYFE